MLSAATWLAMDKWKFRAGRLVAIPVLLSLQGGRISIDMLGGGSCMSGMVWSGARVSSCASQVVRCLNKLSCLVLLVLCNAVFPQGSGKGSD